MKVDKIEALDKRKSKVYLDGDFAFVLYNGELRRYRIEEGGFLEEDVYEEILHDVIFRRARERALYLLKSSAKTEAEIRQKLKSGFCPQEAIEETVRFLERYHYLDDREYARNYVELYGKKKSRAEVTQSLMRKGIDRQVIKELCEESPPDTEASIQAVLKKRGYYGQQADPQKQRKTVAYLMRRGFSWEEIRKAMELSPEEAGWL